MKEYPNFLSLRSLSHLVFIGIVEDHGALVPSPRHHLVAHAEAALQRVGGRVEQRHVHPQVTGGGVRRDGALRVQGGEKRKRKRRPKHQVAPDHL